MYDEPAGHYVYGPRKTVSHSIHGRIGTIPARLTGYGETLGGRRLHAVGAKGWCSQAHGVRRGPAPHPPHRGEGRGERDPPARPCRQSRLLPDAAHVLLPHQCRPSASSTKARATWRRSADVVWAAHAGADYRKQKVGYRTLPAPQMNFHEQVWQHELAADARGEVPVARRQRPARHRLRGGDAQGPVSLPVRVAEPAGRAVCAGHRAVDHHVLGDKAARRARRMIWLEHGDERSYDTTFRSPGRSRRYRCGREADRRSRHAAGR